MDAGRTETGTSEGQCVWMISATHQGIIRKSGVLASEWAEERSLAELPVLAWCMDRAMVLRCGVT